ncbi:MAG: hypothetical protein QNJ98_12130 [Planctomycetota bacterium]|nr:hypothetical protein [Planctomycetota bacterium]
MDRKQLSLIAAICGGVVVIGMFLPVLNAGTSGMPDIPGVDFASKSKSVNGFDKGGALILAFILAAAACAAAVMVFLDKTDAVPFDGRQLLFLAVGAFGLAAVLAVITMLDGDYQTRTIGPVTVGATRGIGLYLMLLGAIGGAAASFLATKQAPSSGGGGDS